MNSTISRKEDDFKVNLAGLEFYPTVGEIESNIYLCFSEKLVEYVNTCNYLKIPKGAKMIWVIDNKYHNSTLYKNMIYMNMFRSLDGIIVIDDNQSEMFSIYFRNSNELVLRVNSSESLNLK